MSVIILNKEKNVTSFKAIKDVQKEMKFKKAGHGGTLDPLATGCLLYTSPSPRDRTRSRMPSSA